MHRPERRFLWDSAADHDSAPLRMVLNPERILVVVAPGAPDTQAAGSC